MRALTRVAPWIFFIACVVTLIQLLWRGESGHYLIFSESAKILWSAKNPYGILYPSAYYLYSPFCGLSFFSLFAFFPHAIGLALYMILSIILFYLGFRSLADAFQLNIEARAIFLGLIFSEIVGAILNTRLELALIGILMLAVGAMLRAEKVLFWSFMLGLIANWKFLTLPATLLWLWSYSFKKKSSAPALMFLLALALSFAFPLFIFSWSELQELHQSWGESMQKFMLGGDNNWLGFQHLFQSLRYFFGYSMSYKEAQITGLIAGLSLFAILLKKLHCDKLNLKELCAYSLSAGVSFSCLFSPLSQSAAYILYAPLLFFFLKINEKRLFQKLTLLKLFISFASISLVYGDLCPRSLRVEIQKFSGKALGVLLLFVFYLYDSRNLKKSARFK
jgi:hypothetical protein